MALLPAPVTVRKDGIYLADALHDRFGMKVLSWTAPKIQTFKVLGQDTADGIGFLHLDGAEVVEEDANGDLQPTGETTMTTADWDDDDYVKALTNPTIQQALILMRDMHDWIVGGRIGPDPISGGA